MAGRSDGAQSRPERIVEPDVNSVDEQLRQRRWRILRAVLPISHGLGPLPIWVKTPEQFTGWLIGRLNPAGLRAYFRDLEEIAKQTCDLELLRLARRCAGQR